MNNSVKVNLWKTEADPVIKTRSLAPGLDSGCIIGKRYIPLSFTPTLPTLEPSAICDKWYGSVLWVRCEWHFANLALNPPFLLSTNNRGWLIGFIASNFRTQHCWAQIEKTGILNLSPDCLTHEMTVHLHSPCTSGTRQFSDCSIMKPWKQMMHLLFLEQSSWQCDWWRHS